MKIQMKKVKAVLGNRGTYTANNYILRSKKDGTITAFKNPRYTQVIGMGGKLTASWEKEVSIVVDNTPMVEIDNTKIITEVK